MENQKCLKPTSHWESTNRNIWWIRDDPRTSRGERFPLFSRFSAATATEEIKGTSCDAIGSLAISGTN